MQGLCFCCLRKILEVSNLVILKIKIMSSNYKNNMLRAEMEKISPLTKRKNHLRDKDYLLFDTRSSSVVFLCIDLYIL